MTAPKTNAEIDASIDEILADIPKYKRESDEKTRRENPHLTEEQVQASWERMAQMLGLNLPSR